MKLFLLGYGKMGQAVHHHAAQQGHEVVGHCATSDEVLPALAAAVAADAQVVVEFTQPHAAFHNIKACLNHELPVVSGTTGWLEHKAELDAYCLEIGGAYIQASNFSVGVHLFLDICHHAAKLLGQYGNYSPRLLESHHTEKKDMPSGTALLVQQAVAAAIPDLEKWYLTNYVLSSIIGEGLPITSIREAGVPGTHTLSFGSAEDSIVITHEANNRDGFAKGALMAAEWIIGRRGIYTMQDVLGLRF